MELSRTLTPRAIVPAMQIESRDQMNQLPDHRRAILEVCLGNTAELERESKYYQKLSDP